jgi:maltooligosyltrehalose trehalohydrolase
MVAAFRLHGFSAVFQWDFCVTRRALHDTAQVIASSWPEHHYGHIVMAEIHVWAPHADRVELESNGRCQLMAHASDGWWSLDFPRLLHGADYGFRLDEQGPFPDPRSAWQPQGVHGASRWVDHGRFDWTDAAWQAPPLSSAIVEEIHIGTFARRGTFDAAIEHLDHLCDLGITHVELMPVAEFSGNRGWGYDGVQLFAPHHAYGGPDALKRLVDACHRKGLAVLLDVVYNHLGPSGNYLGRFGPYFTDTYATPWGEAVNFDGAQSVEVRRFFIDNALMWLRDYHFDGLRIDAVHAIFDSSAIHFLEQLAEEVRQLEASLGRHVVLIAESDLNDPRLIRPCEAGGYGLDAMWNEDFHHALHAALSGERGGYYGDFGCLADVAKVLTRGLVYDGCYSAYRQRMHGRSAAGLPGRRFVGCLQNHDQVGNRARGERSSHLLSVGRLKIGSALVLTSPFVPMLFQGEEWAATTPFLYFTGHPDTDLGEAVLNGRRQEFIAFGWDPAIIPDPQDMQTYERSRLRWEETRNARHAEILQWHQALICLRRTLPELADDRLESIEVRFDEASAWLLVVRAAVVVACNLGGTDLRLACSECRGKCLLLASQKEVALQDETVVLPPESVAILGDERP